MRKICHQFLIIHSTKNKRRHPEAAAAQKEKGCCKVSITLRTALDPIKDPIKEAFVNFSLVWFFSAADRFAKIFNDAFHHLRGSF